MEEEDEEEEEIKLQIDLIVSWRNFISLIRFFSRPSDARVSYRFRAENQVKVVENATSLHLSHCGPPNCFIMCRDMTENRL